MGVRKLFNQWLRSNRGEGPKPSGVCLWQDVKQLEQLTQDLTEQVMQQDDDDWEMLQLKLRQRA